MKEEIPQNNEEEKYEIEHLIGKGGMTEDRFINKKTGMLEKRVWSRNGKREAEVILDPKTGAVKQAFAYDKGGNIVEFIDHEALDEIDRELFEARDQLLTEIMFKRLDMWKEMRRRFRGTEKEEERGN